MKEHHARIIQQMKQLSDLGYRNYQIDEVVRDVVDTTKLDNISTEQLQMVEEALQEYIAFRTH